MKTKAVINSNLGTTLSDYLKEIDTRRFRSLDAYRWCDGDRIHARTYGQLNADSRRIASYLYRRFGKGTHTHIALFGETSYAWMTAYFGIMVSGCCISVPMDVKLDMKTTAARLKRADVTVLLISNRFMHLSNEFKKSCPSLKIVNMDELTDLAKDGNESFETEIDSGALAQLMFTSGTTKEGNGKIVMLSHSNIMSVCHGSIHLCDPGERVLSMLPIHHCFELMFVQLSYLQQGATICINSDISDIASSMRLYEPNYIITVPLIATMFAAYIDKNKNSMSRNQIIAYFGGSLKKVGIGGAAVRPEVIKTLRSVGIHVFHGYGLTEAAGGCIINTANTATSDNSVGIPFIEGLQTAIIDGELCLRGPNTMLGYYKDKELTEKTVIDGWLHTGDLGYLKGSIIFLKGRKDNLIIFESGENVCPEELEKDLKSIPGVAEAIVYKAGNCLHAGIQLKDPAEKEDDIRREIDVLNQKLPSYKKIVKSVFQTERFPTTTSMKVKRKDATELLLQKEKLQKEKEPHGGENPNSPETKIICNAFAKALGMDEFDENANFFHRGGDSLKVLSATNSLRNETDYEHVTPDMVYRYPTPKLLHKHLCRNQEKQEAENHETKKLPGINSLISRHSRMPAGLGKNILLTGGSGYLGTHVLRVLVEKGYNVTCLIRNQVKFSNSCKYYFPGEDFSTVRLVTGDITKENLGLLSETEYLDLASWTDTVFHLAADVRHLAPDSELEKANLHGTENMIEFAICSKAKMFHTSTFSVAGFNSKGVPNVLSESVLDIGQEISQNAYIKTKYRSEEAVINAREKGLHTCIMRMGNLSRRLDGVFQYNDQENGLESQLKAFQKLGVYPSGLSDLSYDFSSVDESAKAFVLLAENSSEDSIYHVINPNRQKLSQLGLAVPVPMDVFSRRVAQYSNDRDVMILSMYMQMIEQNLNYQVDCSKTVERLEELGFEWSDPSPSETLGMKAC